MLSLVIINATIGLVAGARLALGGPALGDGLYGDLSTVFNGLLVGAAAFAFFLGLSWCCRRGPRLVRGLTGVAAALLFALVVAATIVTGVAIPLLIRLHRQTPRDHPLLVQAFGAGRLDWFNGAVEFWTAVALVLAALIALGWLGGRVVVNWWREVTGRRQGWGLTTVVLVLAVLLGVGVAAAAGWLALGDWGGVGDAGAGRGVVWVLLVAVSVYVRRILIEYVGDVAAYVQPHTLDRFEALRDKIKDEVRRRARAIYAAGATAGRTFEYAKVAVVGHSLGSVVAYDTLNRLIGEDLLVPPGALAPRPLHVARRTCLFLTFGSPLDKTAFVFGAQSRLTEGRSALAATVQPLLLRGDHRPFPWVNVWSRWDPISGPLDYYDPPGRPATRTAPAPVDNQIDPAATTLFVAHLQYWDGALIFRALLEALPAAAGAHPGLPVARGTTGLARI